MQGLTIRYMLQNVCQIRCKYESHVILLFCFMASRGIFGRQGTGMHDRHWSGDLFRCLHNSSIWYISASYFHFCVELFVFCYQLSVSMGQKSRVKFWNCWVFLLSLEDSCWALIWWISENPEPESKNYFQTKRKKSVCFQLHSVPKNGVSEYIPALGNTAELAERGSRACC